MSLELRMSRRLIPSLSALALICAASTAQALTVDVGAYAGRYFISGQSGAQFGNHSYSLAAGNYWLDDGAYIGAAYGASGFSFSVDGSGEVSCATAAATCSGGSLHLNSSTLQIDSGNYAGRYLFSAYYPQVFHGDQSLSVLPGLLYSLDNGTAIGGSAFIFALDAAGQVISHGVAASGNGSSLRLNSVAITINPHAYAGSYTVSSYSPQSWSGSQTLELLPGLAYGLQVGSRSISFSLDASGKVSTTAADAYGSGHTLNLFSSAAVPEPGVLALLALGSLAWPRRRKW